MHFLISNEFLNSRPWLVRLCFFVLTGIDTSVLKPWLVKCESHKTDRQSEIGEELEIFIIQMTDFLIELKERFGQKYRYAPPSYKQIKTDESFGE